MKMFMILLGFLIHIFATHTTMVANSLDGTTNLVYATPHQVFHDGDVVQGFVRINNGFSLVPAASVLFDTFITVSGGIDLKTTGILNLNSDVNLDSSVTLTTGGILSGRGHTILLNGNLTLTSTTNVRTLTIRSDTVIDGQGRSLIIGDRSQLFVESNITLTLRNLVLKSGKYGQTPPIRLASLGSKLTLDNVIVDLGSDFDFPQGQIFIHNDVDITGTSAFIYRSPRPSYITSGSTLTFDIGTTFSMAPAAFTDALFSNVPTTTGSNFLVMQDASSALFLNGCSLSTTLTGFRLTKGNLFLDNRIEMNSAATSNIASLSQIFSFAPAGIDVASRISWSPDGRFFAAANGSPNTLQVYRNNNTTITSIGSASTGNNPQSAEWSPNGRYIAVVNNNDDTLQIYGFGGNAAPTAIAGTVATGSAPQSARWSPDGRFIAVASGTGNTLQIFTFNGTSTPVQVGSNVTTGTNPFLDWSPDGRFIAVVNSGSNTLQIYRFDGINTPTTVGTAITTSTTPSAVAWSPDGRFLAVANRGTDIIQVYKFRGTGNASLVSSFDATALNGSQPIGISWSPNGRYILTANRNSGNIFVYEFDNKNTLTVIATLGAIFGAVEAASWSPDGRFIVVGPTSSVRLISVNLSNTIIPQAFSQSIVFGDRIKGVDQNLNVRFLGGAHVELTGKMKDDCA